MPFATLEAAQAQAEAEKEPEHEDVPLVWSTSGEGDSQTWGAADEPNEDEAYRFWRIRRFSI